MSLHQLRWLPVIDGHDLVGGAGRRGSRLVRPAHCDLIDAISSSAVDAPFQPGQLPARMPGRSGGPTAKRLLLPAGPLSRP
jgi:hypothetical protein